MNLKSVPVKGPIRATVRDPQGYCSTIRNWKRFFGGSFMIIVEYTLKPYSNDSDWNRFFEGSSYDCSQTLF